MPTRQALDLARQQGVDLVEISPNAQPPVCRIIDYSKFLYQQKKRQKEMKQKQVKVEVKEIRFGPQTDDHDYQFKLKHAKEFLEVEQLPRLEGKKMFLFLAPKKAGVAKQSQQKRDRLAAEAAARENSKAREAEDAEKKGLLNNAKGAEALLKLKADGEE